MGCNTSKDSVPQAESENKEKQGVEEAQEGRNNENQIEGEENHVNESSDTKSISAKTITLRSNGTAKSVEEAEAVERKSKTAEVRETGTVKQIKENTKDSKDQEQSEQGEEEEAATRIQAAFRGHRTRQSMKQPAAGPAAQQAQAADEPTREQLEQEFRLDDAELCQAATKIQASFRGHMTRKHELEAKKNEPSSCQEGKKEKNNVEEEEELDIDLSDPDLNKAAIKIQASFRGHMVRKENEGEAAAK